MGSPRERNSWNWSPPRQPTRPRRAAPCRRREGPRSGRPPPGAGCSDGRRGVGRRGLDSRGLDGRGVDGRGVDRRCGCEAVPGEAAETGSLHAARLLGCARPGVPVVHPVAAPARRSRPGTGLGDHRGDRLRAGRLRRLGLARVRRPGPPAAPDARAWRIFLVSAAVLLVVSFGLGQYWQHEIRAPDGGDRTYNLALVVASLPWSQPWSSASHPALGRGLRGLYRSAARLLSGGSALAAAAAVGWVLVVGLIYAGGHRGAARRARQRRRRGVLGARHHDARGRAAADHRPALRRPRLAGAVGLPGLRRGALHRRSARPPADIETVRRTTRRWSRSGPTPAWRPAATPSPGRPSPSQDLERAGGFQRKNLLVVTTTGSGWVDPAPGGHLRVPHRRRRGDGRDPVLLPAVLDLLPGRPVQGPRGRPGPVRRRLRHVVEAAGRTSVPGCSSPARASARSAARPPSAASTTCATAPTARCSPAHPTSTRCSASSATTVTRAARRSSPSTRTGGPSGSPTTPGPAIPPAGAARGTAPGCST